MSYVSLAVYFIKTAIITKEDMMGNETKKQQILIRIEKLQQTRDYADEVESAKLTKKIAELFEELDRLDNK
jgi:hypothetical protein